MEQEAALKLWQISEDSSFRYTTLLSDADANTYQYLNTKEVYGPEIKIKKEECINHVSKRLGTSLRKAVKEWRARGVSLGGKSRGSLKEETIKIVTLLSKCDSLEQRVPCPLKTASKPKKKLCKKRKQKSKDSTEEFIFPKKTARPISPTSTQDPIETNNSFSDLEQDVEHPPPTAKVKVEGYLVRGITQCFNCNNFYHTAANCYMRPRCLKCGKDHATRNCHIKERQENPFCINYQDFGHSACYTKCPKFPQPKKGTAFSNPIARKNFSSKSTKEGISFANIVSGEIPSQTPPETETENLTVNEKENSPSGFVTQENNSSDFSQVLELFNTISNLVKKNLKILDLLSKFKTANSDEEKTCLLAEAIMNKI
ncbi:uncharacterized protein TNCV_2497171 [Trichonephila clavipes]|nr:uncharacterized protein TNCV_2497171 [Trichonephila clavipes]